MRIMDLTDEHVPDYLICLEEWSEDMKDSGTMRSDWLREMRDKGLRVKLALDEDERIGGFIQYAPVEHTHVQGSGCYFAYCIWVHGHKAGRGDLTGKGMGKALLAAAEDDAKALGATGLACWGLSLPFWMRASWFKKHGYRKCDRMGIAELVFKPFLTEADAPHWVRATRKPKPGADKVSIVSFASGWCSALNIAHTRAERVARQFPGKVEYKLYNTRDKDVFDEWGFSDAIFIDGKELRTGPPPSEESIRKIVEKRVKRRRL